MNLQNPDIRISPCTDPEKPDSTPPWHRCLSCEDWGVSCRGFDITSLSDIEEVRTADRAIRRAKNITIKSIADCAKQKISDSTVSEYFGNEKKDYKFTTVATIHQSMLQVYSRIKGIPLPVHSCPASSSEMRNQLAAADLKIAAAELRAAQSETDLDALRQKLADTKGKHIAQIAQLETAHEKDLDWMKDEVRLWRRFAFLLLGVGVILLTALVFFVAWDIAHPATGLIRY